MSKNPYKKMMLNRLSNLQHKLYQEHTKHSTQNSVKTQATPNERTLTEAQYFFSTLPKGNLVAYKPVQPAPKKPLKRLLRDQIIQAKPQMHHFPLKQRVSNSAMELDFQMKKYKNDKKHKNQRETQFSRQKSLRNLKENQESLMPNCSSNQYIRAATPSALGLQHRNSSIRNLQVRRATSRRYLSIKC